MGCELLSGCWEAIPGHLQEQQVNHRASSGAPLAQFLEPGSLDFLSIFGAVYKCTVDPLSIEEKVPFSHLSLTLDYTRTNGRIPVFGQSGDQSYRFTRKRRERIQ